MSYILFRYLHFLAIFGLAGALIIENAAISRTITSEDARNLAKVDAIYAVCALFVLLFGLVLWFGVGKPSVFYSDNPLFIAKLGLFIIIALVSIYPTLFMLKHRKSMEPAISVPASVIWLMRIELIVLVFIPILAVLMARGVGLSN